MEAIKLVPLGGMSVVVVRQSDKTVADYKTVSNAHAIGANAICK